MLFVWKRTLSQLAAVTGVLLLLAAIARAVFDVSWRFTWGSEHTAQFGVALGVVLLSDFGSHALAWHFRPGYRASYAALVRHFEGQNVAHFLLAGCAAAAEELFFRGVILESLRTVVPTGCALLVSALAFGLAHTPARPTLRIFGLFATWEGVLLGIVYLASGSILVTLVFHGIHDIGGYAFFAIERRRGIWLR